MLAAFVLAPSSNQESARGIDAGHNAAANAPDRGIALRAYRPHPGVRGLGAARLLRISRLLEPRLRNATTKGLVSWALTSAMPIATVAALAHDCAEYAGALRVALQSEANDPSR